MADFARFFPHDRIIAFLLLLGVIGLGTVVEYACQHTKLGAEYLESINVPVRLLCCFSLITSCQRLVSVAARPKPVQLTGTSLTRDRVTKPSVVSLQLLDGLRVLAILWIVVSHCSGFTQLPLLMKVSPFVHYPHDLVRSKADNWLISTYLVNTYYAVSMFFMIR